MSCNAGNMRKEIWQFLNEDDSLTAKDLCKMLNVSYKKYRNYVTKEKSEWRNWKYYHENGAGSKCSSVRRCFWDCLLPVGVVDRVRALGVGWVLSGNRNRHLVFRGLLGRLQWFETGRVVLFVRKPADVGRAKQLFCDGFTRTGLLNDLAVLDKVFATLRLRGGKADYLTEQKLPYLVIRDFKETNGVTIIIGDRSHPNGVHVLFEYQDQVLKADRLISGFLGRLQDLFGVGGGVGKPLNGDDYAR